MTRFTWWCGIGALMIAAGVCGLFALAVFSIATVGIGPGLTDFEAKVGDAYLLRQTSAQQVDLVPISGWQEESETIPPKVLACGVDARFLIAKQQKLDAKGNQIRNNYQYWIVDALKKKRYGPFTEQVFAAKRKELGVPDSIEFRSANSYRP